MAGYFSSWLTRRQKRCLLRLGLVIFAFGTVLAVWRRVQWSSTTRSGAVPRTSRVEFRESDGCTAQYRQDGIAVIVKTSAAEDLERLRMLLGTSLRCVQNLLLVSDLDATVDGVAVHDVLLTVDPSIRDHHPDFDPYHAQQILQAQGFTSQQLRNVFQGNKKVEVLGKYVVFHMLRKAYEELPGKEWYVFLVADTFLDLSNLVAWLQRLDASQKLFIGAPVVRAGVRFNDLGSGFVLSAPTLRTLATQPKEWFAEWDRRTGREESADVVLSMALKDLGVKVSGAWPMLGGERPEQIPYGPMAGWCQGVISLEGITGEQMEGLYAVSEGFEKVERVLTYKDLYHKYLPNGLPSVKPDWDNSCPGGQAYMIPHPPSAPEDNDEGYSMQACGTACNASPSCMQYLHRKGECRLFSCFTLGSARRPEDGRSWHSAWRLDRIRAWIEEKGQCEVGWIEPSIENRMYGGLS